MSSQDIGAVLREANRLAAGGRWQDAESLCKNILRLQPRHADAWLLRGVIELQSGRTSLARGSLRNAARERPMHAVTEALLGDAAFELADLDASVRHYDEALRIDPSLVPLHFPRANALLRLNRAVEALVAYDCFLAHQPAHAEGWFNRGNALLRLTRWEAAIESFDRAIAAKPDYAEAFNNRGSAALSLRQTDAALASFEAAVAIDPTFADAHNNRGIALRELKRPSEAQACFERAVALRSDFADALRGRGDALMDQGRFEEALASFDRAALLAPHVASSHMARGNALRALRRSLDALASYDEALRLDHGDAVAHFNRGALLLETDEYAAQACKSFDAALRLKPDFIQALRLRADTWETLQRPADAIADLQRVVMLDADFDYARGALFHAKQNSADWTPAPLVEPRALESAVLDGRRADSPFSFLAVSDDPAAQLQCARTYAADRCGGIAQRDPSPIHRHERIRVAYVSADLRHHAVSYLMAGVFERHAAAHFETFAFSLKPQESSDMGRRIAGAFEHFVDISGCSDEAATDLMHRAQIDIAVDLTGYTDGCRPRIFAARVAPIQVNYLGFPGTLGAAHMDYILADEFAIPAARRSDYAESVVYLPDSFQANDDRLQQPANIPTRRDCALPGTAFVFCCFNNTYKIHERVFLSWMRILKCVPGSILWLLGNSATVRANLSSAAQAQGVDPGRLHFAERVTYQDHLARLPLADLVLDTLPFNGGTTTSDALRMGVPVLSCPGRAFAARMGGSLLLASGVPELIASSPADYEVKAVELASSAVALRTLRERLHAARNTGHLFDTNRMRMNLEAAYRQMLARHEAGLPPQSFHVDGP